MSQHIATSDAGRCLPSLPPPHGAVWRESDFFLLFLGESPGVSARSEDHQIASFQEAHTVPPARAARWMICRSLLVCAKHTGTASGSGRRSRHNHYPAPMVHASRARSEAPWRGEPWRNGLMARMRDSTAAPPSPRQSCRSRSKDDPGCTCPPLTAQRRQARFHLPLDGIPPQPSSDRRERRVALL